MDVFTKLFILALVSLHQYVPREQMDEKYFETTVNPHSLSVNIDPRTLVASAHQTCRYLVTKGQQELGTDEQSLVTFLMTMIDEKSDSVKNYGTTPAILKRTIRDICRSDFNWNAFPNDKLLELSKFLNTEIAILTPKDLMSFGEWGLFGQTSLYDRNGTYLGPLYQSMDRWVPLAKISPHVPKALIAIEDKTFLKHQGVELSSLPRILMQMKSSDRASGGSTLTMQILKNFYLQDRAFINVSETQSSSSLNLLRKTREWFWAKPFEVYLSQDNSVSAKEKLLEYYLNLMDYGPSIRGIGQASRVFFGKTADQLTVADAAFIATLFKAPSRYSSPANYENCSSTPPVRDCTRSRRQEVLSEMTELTREESGLAPISSSEKNQALGEPLPQWSHTVSASLFPSEALYLQTHAKDFITDVTRSNTNVLPIEPEMISSIDMNLQDVAHNVIRKKLDQYDSSRYSLGRITVARDDRTDIAELRAEDVTSSANRMLQEYAAQHPELGLDVVIMIKRRESVDLSEFYFSSQNNILRSKEDLKRLFDEQTNSDVFNRLSQGQMAFVATHPEACAQSASGTSTELELLVIPQPCLRILEKDIVLQNLQMQVRQQIILQYTIRFTSYAARPWIQAAYLDPVSEQLLIVQKDDAGDSQLREITLSTGHLGLNHRDVFSKRVRNGSFKPGQMFWVARVPDRETFYLETPKLQATAVLMDSHTGEVYANFGGYSPKSMRYFDRSSMAMRQPGSTLKPWIYYLALSKGFTADSMIQNEGVAFKITDSSTYVPENFTVGSGGPQARLADAFKLSYNKAALGLLTNPFFGPDRFENLDEFINLLSDVGLYNNETVQHRPSIVLGAQEVNMLNLVTSFTFFANGQHIVKPTYFRSVKNGQGVLLYSSDQMEMMDVPHSENRAAVNGIQRLLLDVANSGTAAALKNFPTGTLGLSQCSGKTFGVNGQVCFGGKTGTSSDKMDNWFMGISKNFVLGVWIGYDFRETTNATGGELALPVFMEIIQQGQQFLPAIEPLISE